MSRPRNGFRYTLFQQRARIREEGLTCFERALFTTCWEGKKEEKGKGGLSPNGIHTPVTYSLRRRGGKVRASMFGLHPCLPSTDAARLWKGERGKENARLRAATPPAPPIPACIRKGGRGEKGPV